MSKREGDESRKNLLYGIWINPKCYYNGQSATKLRIGESSTTIPEMEVHASAWKWVAPNVKSRVKI